MTTTLTNEQLLEKVKIALGITGDYQNDTLAMYIDEVKEYLLGAGVSQSIVDSSSSVGVIARGVSDLWNYGSGNTELSPYFMQRAIQLAYKKEE